MPQSICKSGIHGNLCSLFFSILEIFMRTLTLEEMLLVGGGATSTCSGGKAGKGGKASKGGKANGKSKGHAGKGCK